MNVGRRADIRPFPFPYQALLAICSDLDATKTADQYFEILRFLNTSQPTSMGRGLGLEVGNSIYFDMPSHLFSYWNARESQRKSIRELIRSGHIDCLHSFGDEATTRVHCYRALAELKKYGCQIECWVDHSSVSTNFGADIMRGTGDIPGSPAYHADLTYDHGIRFIWRGRVTSVIGQNVRRSYRGIISSRHPVASLRTVAKEAGKMLLAQLGNQKYLLHSGNDVFQPIKLRDGHCVFEFLRCNPHPRGVGKGATAEGLAEVLTEKFLRELISRRGVCILYTHLAKNRQSRTTFGRNTVKALRNLALASSAGDILVATTRRVMRYCAAIRYVSVDISFVGSTELVRISTRDLINRNLAPDLSGLTIYVRNAATARLSVDNVEITDIERHPADDSGRESIGIRWPPLRFPEILDPPW